MMWVLLDSENQIECRFREGAFNDSQQVTPLRASGEYDANALPRIMSEMGAWLAENHYEILFSSPREAAISARRSVGLRLKQAREAKGYTLRQLEKLTGIANNHISRIEQGRYNVTIDTLAILCRPLGVSIGIE